MINRQAKAWIHVALAALAFLVVTGCEPSAAGSSTSARASSGGQSGTRAGTLSITVTKREIIDDLNIRATLRASGGSGGYTWKITGNSGKGNLSSNSGTTVTYITTGGIEDYTQTVSVTDGSGNSASQSISHKAQEGDIKYYN